MNSNFLQYVALLEAITPMLNECFEAQKKFIKCKEGCSHCCEKGYYPVTETEFQLIQMGYEKLDNDTQEIIIEKAKNILAEMNEHLKKGGKKLEFKYECPFLLNNLCSIYNERAIICRTQGLIMESVTENKFNIPACAEIGLNYADAFNENLPQPDSNSPNFNVNDYPQAFDMGYESLLQVLGINPETLADKLNDDNDNEIRMMFEYVVNQLQKTPDKREF